MRAHTYQRKRILQNTNCAECREKVTTRLPGDLVVILNGMPYFVHSKCVYQIVSARIVDTLDRDRHANDLADRLGYTHSEIAIDKEVK